MDYLIKSGKKSHSHYSLEESHIYFEKTYKTLTADGEDLGENRELFIDLLIRWAVVFNFRGDFKGLTNLLTPHEDLVRTLENQSKLGVYYLWLGWAYERRLMFKESYRYLIKATELGEEYNREEIITSASTYLIWTCTDLGLFDEAMNLVERIRKNSKFSQGEFQLCWCGFAYAKWLMGEGDPCIDAGNLLLENGLKYKDNRSSTLGQIAIGWGFYAKGNYPKVIECFREASEIALDPQFRCDARFMLGFCYIAEMKFTAAESIVDELLQFNKEYGFEFMGEPARTLEGVVNLSNGNFQRGLDLLKKSEQKYSKNGARVRLAWQEQLLGNFYFKLAQSPVKFNLPLGIKSTIFLLKSIPFASKKAEAHLKKSIELSSEIGAGGVLGPALLDLGLFYTFKKRTDKAENYLSRAIEIFREKNNQVYLNKAEEALDSIA